MRMGKMVALGLAAASLTLAPVGAEAKEAETCTDGYLLCLNEASQESGWLWRTSKEFECGLDYYACMARKTAGC